MKYLTTIALLCAACTCTNNFDTRVDQSDYACEGSEETNAANATLRTTNLIVDQETDLGDPDHETRLNGPTRQTIEITDPDTDFGEINLMTITGIVPAWPKDMFMQVWRSDNDADCSTHDQHSGGLAVQVSGSRSAGSNNLVNTAIECTAENAQSNYCLHVLKGDFVFDGGGQIVQNTGDAFFGGNYLATGPGTPLIAEGDAGEAYAFLISADPGPTDSIKSLADAPTWNAHHATASTLKLYNDSGRFTLNVSGPVHGALFLPDGIVSATAGTFTTGSTTLTGGLTSVGASSTTITFANAFPARSRCFSQPTGSTAQVITATGSSTTCIFRCFDMAGSAQNCVDFNYWVIGQ